MKTPGGPRGEIPVAAGATPTTTPTPAAASEPYANWSERMQHARSRHSAITRNLYTWSSYKNWAERVKSDWDDGSEK